MKEPKVPRGYYRTCRKCGAQMVRELLDVHLQLAHDEEGY